MCFIGKLSSIDAIRVKVIDRSDGNACYVNAWCVREMMEERSETNEWRRLLFLCLCDVIVLFIMDMDISNIITSYLNHCYYPNKRHKKELHWFIHQCLCFAFRLPIKLNNKRTSWTTWRGLLTYSSRICARHTHTHLKSNRHTGTVFSQ